MTETPTKKENIFKRFFKKIGGFIKRHKVLTVVLVIVALLVFVVISFLNNVSKAAASLAAKPQTITLEKMNLEQIVSGSGTVQSATARQVSTALTSKITQVLVKEGDYVKPGDVLCQLDTTDIDKSIADAKKDIAKARGTDKINLDAAQRRLDDAIRQRSNDEANHNRKVQEAGNAINNARAAAGVAAGNLALQTRANTAADNDPNVKQLKSAWEEAQKTLTAAQSDLALAQALEAQAQVEYEAAIASARELAPYEQARQDATANYEAKDALLRGATDMANEAKVAYDIAHQAAYNTFVNSNQQIYTDEYNKAYNNANVSALQSAYDTAVEMRDTSLRTDDSAIAAAREALALQKLVDSATGLKVQLEKYEKDRDESTITAPVAGTIIEVNAEVGLTPAASLTAGAANTPTGAGTAGAGGLASAGSSSLFTIKDEGKLEIVVDVPEYDAVNLSTGLPVNITTDAKDGEEWQGIVSNISPAATDAKSNFRVTIAVTSDVADLAIGMSAKVNIVTNSSNNVYAVPYDAVTTDASGQSVIYVVDDINQLQPMINTQTQAAAASGSTPNKPQGRPVVVTTGMETDYYIEISSDELSDGLIVLADPEGKNTYLFDANAFMFG